MRRHCSIPLFQAKEEAKTVVAVGVCQLYSEMFVQGFDKHRGNKKAPGKISRGFKKSVGNWVVFTVIERPFRFGCGGR